MKNLELHHGTGVIEVTASCATCGLVIYVARLMPGTIYSEFVNKYGECFACDQKRRGK